MPEPTPSTEDRTVAAARRGIRWDALAAIIAALVGLLALVVAGYTAYIQRQQVRAQVWPYLYVDTHDFPADTYLFARNNGVGPVIIRSVQVLVDGKPAGNWRELGRLVGFHPAGAIGKSTLNHTVLAPGDQVHWLVFHDYADFHPFLEDWARFHVEARICYASTLGESWLLVFSPPRVSTPQPVENCPVLPASEQFSD